MWVRFPLAWFLTINNAQSPSPKLSKPLAKTYLLTASNSKTINHDNINLIKVSFTSIFNPHCLLNLRLLCSSNAASSAVQFKFKKVLVKQSYLLLLWAKLINSGRVGVTFSPRRNSRRSTKTKSPMAHKTYSQEQFTFQIYKYSFSKIPSRLRLQEDTLSLRAALFLFLSSKQQNYFWGTSFLFLTKISLSLISKDTKFFLVQN